MRRVHVEDCGCRFVLRKRPGRRPVIALAHDCGHHQQEWDGARVTERKRIGDPADRVFGVLILAATAYLLLAKPAAGGILLALLLVRMCWWGARQPKVAEKATGAVGPSGPDEDDVWFEDHKSDRVGNKRYYRESMAHDDMRRGTP